MANDFPNAVMKRMVALSRALALAALAVPGLLPVLAEAPADLEDYEVVWNSPSRNAAGSMPIGNGELGLNVWVEEDGDLRFYLARSDCWSEASRLLKLGGVRVALNPNPFTKGAPFRQVLRLREGRIEIRAGGVDLRLFVDARAPVVHLLGASAQPLQVQVSLECWRDQKKVLTGDELSSSWTMQAAPPEIEVWESADVILPGSGAAITWYHRNEHSCVPLTLRHQGLANCADRVSDPLRHRTFGGTLRGAGLERVAPGMLRTSSPVREFGLRVATHSAITPSAEAWEAELTRQAAVSPDGAAAEKATSDWWRSFWDRSWVFAKGDRAETAGLPSNHHPLRLGVDSTGGNRFHGAMSRASVYGRALSDGEIAELAAGGPGATSTAREGQILGGRLDRALPGMQVTGAVRFEDTTAQGVRSAAFEGGHLAFPAEGCTGLKRSFTLEAWIWPEPASGTARIFDKLTAGQGDGFLLDTHPGRSLRLIVGGQSLAATDVLAPGAWNHVAAVFDAEAEGRRLYLNGKLLKAEGAGGMDQPTPSAVTRAFILQRWMAACAGRGSFPTKFNGSIFTVDPEYTGGEKTAFNPDWRRWGDCFWWQNTRFPAWSAVANGDYDLCSALFRLYREVLPICRERAQRYYGAGGAYFPETMTCFGTYSNRDYGWNRDGKQAGEVACKYWRWSWQQGLELVALMLDCHERTLDQTFLESDLLPMARDVLGYFDTRFARDAQGKLVISPTQAVETYWSGVVNDTPTVAGLQAVLDRLLALPQDVVPATDRAFWTRLKAAAPPLPLRAEHGRSYLAPAEQFDPQRSNCENPELYAIWPFRLLALGTPGLETGRETFARRQAKILTGWCYDGQCAALLGLTEEARRQIQHKVRNSNRNFRFPAMWGPNFDWTPDQDHGGNILLTLQHMILNCEGDKIHLLPAWPRDWDLHFKLHAPRRTLVEGRVRGGKLVDLQVSPPERRQDVTVWLSGSAAAAP